MRRRKPSRDSNHWMDGLLLALNVSAAASNAVPGSPATSVLSITSTILQTIKKTQQNTQDVKLLLEKLVSFEEDLVKQLPDPTTLLDGCGNEDSLIRFCSDFASCLQLLHEDVEAVNKRKGSRLSRNLKRAFASDSIRIDIQKYERELADYQLRLTTLLAVRMSFDIQKMHQTQVAINSILVQLSPQLIPAALLPPPELKAFALSSITGTDEISGCARMPHVWECNIDKSDAKATEPDGDHIKHLTPPPPTVATSNKDSSSTILCSGTIVLNSDNTISISFRIHALFFCIGASRKIDACVIYGKNPQSSLLWLAPDNTS